MNRYIKLDAVLDRIAEAYSKHNELVPMWLHIGDIPYADVFEVRHGHWINDTGYAGWTCSECGDHEGNKMDKYCHNCGARMDLVKEQEHEQRNIIDKENCST